MNVWLSVENGQIVEGPERPGALRSDDQEPLSAVVLLRAYRQGGKAHLLRLVEGDEAGVAMVYELPPGAERDTAMAAFLAAEQAEAARSAALIRLNAKVRRMRRLADLQSLVDGGSLDAEELALAQEELA